MFYLKTLKKDLLLEPQFFGPNLHEVVGRLLLEQVEGMSLGNDGFVISVFSQNSANTSMEMGTIEYDTGAANIICTYEAICFRPFRNEVLDATVSNVTDLGFFAEVGPLEIFVSRFNMPEDIANTGYDSVGDMWVSEDKEVEIKKGCGVRLRIIGITVEAELKAVGSMKDDYLGLVSAATI
ncbi:hypothetical protein JKP88DRAFT_269964 [Tribonema minus]|uniref:DNA-directed RNA polymerase II subunit RPB7 n=1 Tax=Tribonema minus TaxID=303371 RepID=A0A835YX29_9STRA|nr:hypothetical protein JKP88DRAFT_269964 [Tribonema minus]|eukprot:TRINITY_DN3634_c0_g1_i1.p1 TRINITY_DN3634_c0_g1~~TRINITY_DN3634_c0_g1_i1.p1  ORF type:complete len:181 (-),score=49.10 TRINITY_DN3634_c0_g1_i1:64-606(-)